MVDCLSLTSYKVHLVQESRDSIQLNQVYDVVLFGKPRESQFKFLVLVDPVSAELELTTAD